MAKVSGVLLRATRGAHDHNLQVVITHASFVCSQHSFGLPRTMNGIPVFWDLVLKGLIEAQGKKESLLVFTFSSRREIRRFHVVVVQ